MKHLITVLIFGILLILPLGLQAQQAQDHGHYMDMQAYYDGDKVMLRWIVSDLATWQEAVQNGFKIERYTTVDNGTPIDVSAMSTTYQLLNPALVPLSDAEWSSQFTDNPYAELAQESLYDLENSILEFIDPTLADAVDAEDNSNFDFMFMLYASNQEFAVAEGLALGYADLTIQSNSTYMYRVTLNSSNPEFAGILSAVTINTNEVIPFPQPEQLSAEGEDLLAFIQWNSISHQEQYLSYDIERSTDNVNFTKVNEFPFNFSTGAEETPKFSIYQDALPDNNTTYYYRVLGRTIYGFSGPPSESISVKGTPPKLELYIKLDESTENNGQIILDWSSFDALGIFEPDLQGYNLYRSLESLRNFEPVNSSLIDPTARTFVDTDGLPYACYYLLEAVDNNDYSYLSPPFLVQPEDTTPPAIPTGLAASFITSERVQLTWDDNTEEDLKGYRVFVGNKAEGTFTQATIFPVEEASYVYEIDASFTIDSVYFKVLALDTHDNCSEKSDCLALLRTDLLPPSNPVLHKVNPTPAGIALGFRFSTSEDVDYHVLERKAVGTPDWETVINVPVADEGNYSTDLNPDENTTTCFIDDATLERREYEYRFVAYDLAGNVSSSDLVKVRPTDNGLRGTIEDFALNVNCIPVGTLENQGGYDLLDSLLIEYKIISQFDFTEVQKLVMWSVITTNDYNYLIDLQPYEINLFLTEKKIEIWGSQVVAAAELSWDYDALNQIQDFQIYRSADNSPLMLYKTLSADSLADYVYEDLDVQRGKRYFYQIIARHLGGGHSPLSTILTIKVPR